MNWSKRYTCTRCDVGWDARVDEAIPNTCWNCEKTDAVSVWTQMGREVLVPDTGKDAANVAVRQWMEETRRAPSSTSSSG